MTILLRKDTPFTWGPEQQQAFDSLKAALTSPPVLAYPDYSQPFLLYTDASTVGLGAALMQLDARGKIQPLAYASRTLNKAETNYSTTHLEALAVVWALKHFRDLIHGYNIIVRTDHAAVVELFNTKSLTGKLGCWSLVVQDFAPTFAHVPGAVNHVADSLSRYIGAVEDEEIEAAAAVATSLDTALNDSIRDAQREDPFCQPLLYYLHSDDPTHLPKLPIPLPEFDLNENLLVRHTYISSKQGPNRDVTQIFIPEKFVPIILYRIHSSPHAGHPGKNRTLLQARMFYYWPTMRLDILNYIDKCQTCAENHGSEARLVPIKIYPIPTEP